MSSEIDVIQHLLDVEREASSMIMEAQLESDKLVNAAREKADSEFKSEYKEIIKNIEEDERLKEEKISGERKALLDSYCQKLESGEKDFKSFNILLDKILSE